MTKRFFELWLAGALAAAGIYSLFLLVPVIFSRFFGQKKNMETDKNEIVPPDPNPENWD